jgi:hypothetical protein
MSIPEFVLQLKQLLHISAFGGSSKSVFAITSLFCDLDKVIKFNDESKMRVNNIFTTFVNCN